MGFHEIRFPANLSFGSVGGPERHTDVVTLANGHEERNTPWAHSRRRYDAGVAMRGLDDIETLIAFFEARQGQLHGFRWKDWSDYKSGPALADPAYHDQIIAIGDDVTASFPLIKAYRSGAALLPGSGEYALATSPVAMRYGPGSSGLANVNTVSGKSDFATSLEAMTGELPNCGASSLIVSWFGDDLRCDSCRLRPKVEQKQYDADNMPWSVAGLSRSNAEPVPRDENDRMIYGGTPADAAVIEAILGLQQSGQEVMVYPFILMEQMAGNGLGDPYSDAADQPVLPWRGRITLPIAPGRAGSTDGTAAADAAVAAFFGTAQAADFTIAPVSTDPAQPGDGARSLLSYGGAVKRSPVSYSGPDEWGYRRFILHHAALCAAAGGVESFCIGSEMRGLTTIRGAAGRFPAVDQLIALAAEVRALLGPEVKISYAADWSEYFGYQPAEAPGDMLFHLDPLWADANIDFVGIDNYMPLSDWRAGRDHADAGWGSIYNPDYLRANIEGGEGYDWFYHSQTAREAQIRTPITDEAEAEPWVWRFKDIRNWWRNGHHDRIGGARQEVPTPWVPMSKPIRFTEFGCAAVDMGTNQPNKFLDPSGCVRARPYCAMR